MKADHPSQVRFAASLPPTCPCSSRRWSRRGDSGITTAGGWDGGAHACWWILKPHWFFLPLPQLTIRQGISLPQEPSPWGIGKWLWALPETEPQGAKRMLRELCLPLAYSWNRPLCRERLHSHPSVLYSVTQSISHWDYSGCAVETTAWPSSPV